LPTLAPVVELGPPAAVVALLVRRISSMLSVDVRAFFAAGGPADDRAVAAREGASSSSNQTDDLEGRQREEAGGARERDARVLPSRLVDATALDPEGALLPPMEPVLRKASRLAFRLLPLVLAAAVEEGALSCETLGGPVVLAPVAAVEDDLSRRSWSWRLLRGVAIRRQGRGQQLPVSRFLAESGRQLRRKRRWRSRMVRERASERGRAA
jgi:hypothetical protein